MALEETDPLAAAVEEEKAEAEHAEAPPPESDAPEPPPADLGDVDPTEALTMALRATADQFAPAWALRDAEIAQVAAAWAAVLQRYLPALLAQHGELVTACYITAIVIYPRAGKPLRLKPPEPPPSDPAEANDAAAD